MSEQVPENKGSAPDLSKVLQDGFKNLRDDLSKLNSRIDKATAPPPAPVRKQEPVEEDDLSSLILVDPEKAVGRITAKVRESVMNTVASESSARDNFQSKFLELQGDYPEIANQASEVHKRAKEILETQGADKFDAGALERAVLRAAAESGVLPMKHRRQPSDNDDGDDYLGGSSNSGGSNSRRKSGGKSDKLPAATLAFAAEVGMDVKDPKVVEKLTKRYNDRKDNWNKYK